MILYIRLCVRIHVHVSYICCLHAFEFVSKNLLYSRRVVFNMLFRGRVCICSTHTHLYINALLTYVRCTRACSALRKRSHRYIVKRTHCNDNIIHNILLLWCPFVVGGRVVGTFLLGSKKKKILYCTRDGIIIYVAMIL